MDIKLIRIANINFLANKHGRERLAECDERGKWTTNYINQLCGGFGSFGTGTARRIEKGLGLSFGWMDMPHSDITYGDGTTPPTDDATKAQMLNLWDKMTPEGRAQLLKIGLALSEQ